MSDDAAQNEAAFREWLGDQLAASTVREYAGVLRKLITSKVRADVAHDNLFCYSDAAQFLAAVSQIQGSPDFGPINKAEHNRFSSAMSQYSIWLHERAGVPAGPDALQAAPSPEPPGTGPVTPSVHYWLYSPGEQATMWDEFHDEGIMALAWDEADLGDLLKYHDRTAVQSKLKQYYGKDRNPLNSSLALWQFTHKMREGDIVFVKRGMHRVVGQGVVASGYVYDDSRQAFRHIREVRWTHYVDRPFAQQLPMKALTDITQCPDLVEAIKSLFAADQADVYGEAEFLDEVFMPKSDYATLTALLRRKKNIILQGAPGVGKTFAARRLAYSVMGQKDDSRIRVVQFHQSYSYEDFVMGYRPQEKGGFDLQTGPFYQFCKQAQSDPRQAYFFIIDEINRGNLSKVFGELLMLVEADKRGPGNAIQLLYKAEGEPFFVPENLYIIGMMNTADRSLAMLDYALRRRFAFFEMAPAFDSEGFARRRDKAVAVQPRFDSLINAVKELNTAIAADHDLGPGFQIGHSYFCADEETMAEPGWLQSVVEYELIPLLDEYWFNDERRRQSWSDRLRGVARGQ